MMERHSSRHLTMHGCIGTKTDSVDLSSYTASFSVSAQRLASMPGRQTATHSSLAKRAHEPVLRIHGRCYVGQELHSHHRLKCPKLLLESLVSTREQPAEQKQQSKRASLAQWRATSASTSSVISRFTGYIFTPHPAYSLKELKYNLSTVQ